MARRSKCLYQTFFVLAVFSLLLSPLVYGDSHFEGFEAEDGEFEEDQSVDPASIRSPPVSQSTSHATKLNVPDPSTRLSDSQPDPQSTPSDLPKSRPSATFEYWDEDEFEGLPEDNLHLETPESTENDTPDDVPLDPKPDEKVGVVKPKQSFTIEIICGSFLVMFAVNYFTGKKENEDIALSWASEFATKDSIFEKNFSLLGVGDGDDSPLLLKEGTNVFKLYASGRRYCQGLLATMELKSRHDLISRLYNMVIPTRDEITFEVYMNDDAMDHVVFALAKKKVAKTMQKDLRDLQRFATLVTPPIGRKWVTDDLAVIAESKEVAGDLITEAVLEQVFSDKAFEKFGRGFISLHFSDQHRGAHKKMLEFKFVLPSANNMADMTRLVALIPYYIDLIGRYKLSSQARSKTEAARQKAAQEMQKELLNARQEALQKRKAERKKMEEAEAKLSAEAIRKREAKERTRQMKKTMPKIKMARA